MPHTAKHLLRFRKLAIFSLIAVYLLILIGSSVRASGAGMGCPDWPTCFGKFIPPVNVSQLPKNYQEIYAERGYSKQPFNASKTWIEFGNRLSGATTGLLITLLFFYALIFLKKHPRLQILSGAIALITGFQGWLGSIVVSSNLHPLMISSHMLLALVMIVCLHSLIEITTTVKRTAINKKLRFSLLTSTLLLIIQIAIGIDVREQIDSANAILGDERAQWIDSLDTGFIVHRAIGVTLFATTIFCLFFIYRQKSAQLLAPLPILWVTALAGSLISGLSLFIFMVPPVAQPFHLLFASLQFGIVCHILLRLMRSQSPVARRHV